MCRRAIWRGMCGAALLAATIPALAAVPASYGQVSLDDLEVRYRLPNSRFIDVDGARVHYVDEGKGPVVVLLHGSYYSLREWSDWSKALIQNFRVIRMDRLRFGLTRNFPDHNVSYDSEVALLEGFTRALGLTTFSLAGGSSGGIVAALYADRHPDNVKRLILFNFPLGHGRITSDDTLREMSRVNVARGWQTPEYTKLQLQDGLVDQSRITPELVQRMTDFANREDPGGKSRAAFSAAAGLGEPERKAMLGRLKMPVLVLWSEKNRTLSLANGEAAFAAIGSTQKRFSVAMNVGHAAPIEGGAATARAASVFFLGNWPPSRLTKQR